MIKTMQVWLMLYSVLLSHALLASGLKRTLVFVDDSGLVQVQNSAQVLSKEQNDYLDLIHDHSSQYEYKKAASSLTHGRLMAILDDVPLVKIRMVLTFFSRGLSPENKTAFVSQFFNSIYPGTSIKRLQEDIDIFMQSLASVGMDDAQASLEGFVEGRMRSLGKALSSRQRAAFIRAKMIASLADGLRGNHGVEMTSEENDVVEVQEGFAIHQSSLKTSLLLNKKFAQFTGVVVAFVFVLSFGALLDQTRYIQADQFKVYKRSVQVHLPENPKLLISDDQYVQVGDVIFETFEDRDYHNYTDAVLREKAAIEKNLNKVQEKLFRTNSTVEAAQLKLAKVKLDQKALALNAMRMQPQGQGVLVSYLSPLDGISKLDSSKSLEIVACSGELTLLVSPKRAQKIDFTLPVRFDYGDRQTYQDLQPRQILKHDAGMIQILIPVQAQVSKACNFNAGLRAVQFQRK